MKTSFKPFLGAAAGALFFALTLATTAQEQKPAPSEPPPPPSTAPAAPAPEATTAPAAPSDATTPAPVTPAPGTPAEPAAEPKKDEPLRRLDTNAGESVEVEKKSAPRRSERTRSHDGPRGERVAIGHDIAVGKGEHVEVIVAVFGSLVNEGEVSDRTLSVLGDSRITGPVNREVVVVLGDAYVNSKVGRVVSVLGDLELGPDAVVEGDVFTTLGDVKRDPKSVVRGSIRNVPLGGEWGGDMEWLRVWFTKCVLLGRPLAFDHRLGWAWGVAFCFLAFYMLLALLFRRGLEKCAETLETRPGSSILTAILTILLSPVAIVLLCITVVGIVVVPFLSAGLFFATLFGKAVMLAWIGRRFTKFFGNGPLAHASVAVLIGGIIALLLYTIPFFGFFAYKLLGWLGVGVVVYTIILSTKRERTPAVPQAPAPAPFVASPSAAPSAMSSGFSAPRMDPAMLIGGLPAQNPPPASFGAPVTPPAPPPVVAVALPRASIWLRLAALGIDGVLILLILGFTRGLLPSKVDFDFMPGGLLMALAIYGAILWKLKGTTIGGIVCGLKVVRTDNREIDWATAIVRALACFLSLFVAGLGFIWIAIDDDRQSWHDKIAGTIVVRLPKGFSLV